MLAGAACGRAPQEPVEGLIHDVSLAVEARDAAAVGERLAQDFRGEGGMTKSDALGVVRRYFAGYERVDVELYDVQREAERLTFRVDFTGKPRDVGGLAGLLPVTAVYEFELELGGEANDLKVQGAAWRPWTPPADE